jgi:hypothetical protein
LAGRGPQEASQGDVPTIEQARSLQGAGQWGQATGRLEEAIEAHQKAATFDDYHAIALYNLGCAYALTARSDSDLDSLRDDPRFKELLAVPERDL